MPASGTHVTVPDSRLTTGACVGVAERPVDLLGLDEVLLADRRRLRRPPTRLRPAPRRRHRSVRRRRRRRPRRHRQHAVTHASFTAASRRGAPSRLASRSRAASARRTSLPPPGPPGPPCGNSPWHFSIAACTSGSSWSSCSPTAGRTAAGGDVRDLDALVAHALRELLELVLHLLLVLFGDVPEALRLELLAGALERLLELVAVDVARRLRPGPGCPGRRRRSRAGTAGDERGRRRSSSVPSEEDGAPDSIRPPSLRRPRATRRRARAPARTNERLMMGETLDRASAFTG